MFSPNRCLPLLTAIFLATLLLAHLPGGTASAQQPEYFSGELLVASPKMRDPRFRKTVLYMVEHNAKGAIGIIINKRLGKGPIAKLMTGFGMDPKDAEGDIGLHLGGPVARNGAFILHTNDYTHDRSAVISGTISFTTDIEILRAVAAGKGPRRILFALGYAGWGPRQLEGEIERGDWSVTESSEDLVFGDGKGDAWERVIEGSEVPL